MTQVLSYIIVLLVGILIGYLMAVVVRNRWLIRHGITPSEFFKEKEEGDGKG